MTSAPVQNNGSGSPILRDYNTVSGRLRSRCLLVLLLTIFCSSLSAQEAVVPDNSTTTIPSPTGKKRIRAIAAIHAGIYAGSFVLLNEAWYKGYERSGFHVFDDSREWQQVDKFGHAWTAYNIARYSSDMWRWAGVEAHRAAWIGAISGAGYLTIIEFLDAHSSRWGWSWSDMGANLLGSGMFLSQQLIWHEQRIRYKFSFHAQAYPDKQTEERADDLFGEGVYERMLKDYNGQTYWFSANLRSFLPESRIPAWLNLAVGYGADGMLGGFENKWESGTGTEITRYDISRKRQFYLAPDIDFTRIKTRSKAVRTLLNLLNMFKCPAPALMLDSKGKVKLYALYF